MGVDAGLHVRVSVEVVDGSVVGRGAVCVCWGGGGGGGRSQGDSRWGGWVGAGGAGHVCACLGIGYCIGRFQDVPLAEFLFTCMRRKMVSVATGVFDVMSFES